MKHNLIFIQPFGEQRALAKDQILPLPILICPQWGHLCLKLEIVPHLCSDESRMKPLTWGRQATQGPVITISSSKTRKPPKLRLKGFIHSGCFFTFSIGSESEYLPNWGTTTAKEYNPCKAQGHLGFSTQKHFSQCRGASRDVFFARGQRKEPEQSQGANALLKGRRLPAAVWTNAFENLLLGGSGKVLVDVMNQGSQGSQREGERKWCSTSQVISNYSKENTLEAKHSGANQCGSGNGQEPLKSGA